MKYLVITFITALIFPTEIHAEPASKYKLTCLEYPCEEEELNAIKLVNKNYGRQLERRLINNNHYPHPWYWVFKRKDKCKYSVAAREDMPTHMATMEWIDVDICKEITKLRTY